MSTILNALAKAKQEKDRQGTARPRAMIKSSPQQDKGRGLRIILLAGVVALSGMLLVAFIRPPWANTVIVALGLGKKQPAVALAVKKPSRPTASKKTESQKPVSDQPGGGLDILMKSKKKGSSGKLRQAKEPAAAPNQTAKRLVSQDTMARFMQKHQQLDTGSATATGKPGKKPSKLTQPGDNTIAGFLTKHREASHRKTGPPPSIAKPGKGLHDAKQNAIKFRELFNKGVDLEKAGKPQEAAALYQKLIALDKSFTQAYINLGNLYLNQLGKPRQAISLYRRALESSPDNPKAHNNLGVACMALKKFSSAEKELLKAAVLDAGFADPLYNLACLFAQKGDAATALFWLKKAHALGGAEIVQWATKDKDLMMLHEFRAYQDFIARIQSTQESLGK